MIKVEGYKAFHGTMRINYGKNSTIQPFEITADWLYKPEYNCWYGNGQSFEAECCEVVDDKSAAKNGEWKSDSDRPDTVICSKCNASEDVWWADNGTKYCPNCGAKMD
jgi:hypothetical protein